MPISYIPFFPDNIEGQALLDNFTRTRRILKYRESDKITTRILRGMPLYETELLETVGDKSENPNLVLRGDCVSACAFLKDQNIKIDLVYIDPPFASGADYAKKVYLRKNPNVASAIAKAEEDLSFDEIKAFEEKMYGDIWNKEDYLNWMYENLMAIKAVMSETASIYVHLDWHIGHYVKILLDEVFGEDKFINEIIWQRFNFHADALRFGTVHETIFFYSKNEILNFNKLTVPFKDSYIKSHFVTEAESGRKYVLNDLTAPAHGKMGIALDFDGNTIAPPKGTMWRFKQENVDKFLKEGKIVFTKTGMPRFKRYLDELEGTAIHTIWNDIPVVNSQAQERIDYATQKPENLLERIIKASSNEGMVVADFFGGSGVTAAVAAKLGRRFIHTDVGINSIQTVRDRLKGQDRSFEVREIKDGVTLYRNPQQTMDNLNKFIDGLKNEDPLPPFWEGYITDSKDGQIPIYLPNLLDHTTKLLDIPWMSRIINEAMPVLPENIKKVIVYYVDIDDEKALTKYINDQNQTRIKIELRDLKPLLEKAIMPDIVEYRLEGSDTEGYVVTIDKFLSDRLKVSIDNYNLKRQQNLLQKARKKEDDKTSEKEDDAVVLDGNGKFQSLTISEDGLELIEMVALDCTTTEGEWHSDTEIKIDKNSFMVRDGKKTKEHWGGTISSEMKPFRLKVRNIAGDETVFSL